MADEEDAEAEEEEQGRGAQPQPQHCLRLLREVRPAAARHIPPGTADLRPLDVCCPGLHRLQARLVVPGRRLCLLGSAVHGRCPFPLRTPLLRHTTSLTSIPRSVSRTAIDRIDTLEENCPHAAEPRPGSLPG